VAKGTKIYKVPDAERAKISKKFSVFYTDWVKKHQSRMPAQKILDTMLELAKKDQ